MNDNLTLDNSPRFRHFDWEKAKTFYYIAQLKSFTRGAEFLRISQSALSRQIQSLEQSLGCPLFIRQPRGLVLTRKGEELEALVKPTFEGLKEFTHNAKKIEREQKRTIRIGINKGIVFLVIEALEAYQHSHPYLTFELVEDFPSKELTLLDLDIALRPFQKGIGTIEQKPFIKLDKKLLFSSSLILSNTLGKLIDLFFVTPNYLKNDPEIEEIYQVLLLSAGNGKEADIDQSEAA